MMRILTRGKAMAAVISVILSITLLLGGTYAWTKSTNSVTNRLDARQHTFDIPAVDVFTPPSAPVEPGKWVSKKVGATNTGDLSGFVRLLVLPTIVAADGITVLPARIGKEVDATLNTSWLYGGDGYYYYLDELEPGQSAPPLFEGVALAAGLDDRYKMASLTIEVKCEAVDTKQWNYRIGWWGSAAAPTNATHRLIDTVLNQLATP
jgi:hypothetical protein